MLSWSRPLARAFFLVSVFVLIPSLHSSPPPSWRGILRDPAGNPIDMAAIKLFAAESNREYSATTSTTGQFAFTGIAPGNYTLTVNAAGRFGPRRIPWSSKTAPHSRPVFNSRSKGRSIASMAAQDAAPPQASGGEHLSTGEVSSLPLNEPRLQQAPPACRRHHDGHQWRRQFHAAICRSTANAAPPLSSPSTERTRPTPNSAAAPFPTLTSTPSRKCNPIPE